MCHTWPLVCTWYVCAFKCMFKKISCVWKCLWRSILHWNCNDRHSGLLWVLFRCVRGGLPLSAEPPGPSNACHCSEHDWQRKEPKCPQQKWSDPCKCFFLPAPTSIRILSDQLEHLSWLPHYVLSIMGSPPSASHCCCFRLLWGWEATTRGGSCSGHVRWARAYPTLRGCQI